MSDELIHEHEKLTFTVEVDIDSTELRALYGADVQRVIDLMMDDLETTAQQFAFVTDVSVREVK